MKEIRRVELTQELLALYISGINPDASLIKEAKELEIDYEYIKEQVESEEEEAQE